MRGRSNPYVVYPPGWPDRARARAFSDLARARRAAQKIADKTGEEVVVQLVSRFGGSSNAAPIKIKPSLHNSRPRDPRSSSRRTV